MTDFLPWTFPVRDDSDERPEIEQGVYREQTFGTPSGSASFFLMMLGYIVQTWSRLYHSGPGQPLSPPIQAVGQGSFSFSDRYKSWEIRGASVLVTHVPNGVDLQFGDPSIIYVGKCTFFRDKLSTNALDWSLGSPSSPTVDQGLGWTVGADINVPLDINLSDAFNGGPNLNLLGNEPNFPGFNTHLPEVQPYLYAAGTLSFGGDTKPKTKVLKAGVISEPRWYYPIQWINFDHSLFLTPDELCNGFAWWLKPGVVAQIVCYGEPKDPDVSFGSSETDHAKFNPMKGGVI